jgi:dCTP deaminase
LSVIPLTTRGPSPTVVQDQEHFQLEAGAALILQADLAQLTGDGESSVSYDLRVGEKCRDHRGWKVNDIPPNGSVTLNPGSALIIQTEEYLHLPRSMYGTIAPKVSLLQRGLSTTFSKVDPGYPGHLLITLFNLGQTRVILHRGECFCSLTLFDVAPGARLYKKGPKQLAAPPASGVTSKPAIRGHFKSGHGKVPGPRCCTLPSAFRASLISEISGVDAHFLLGGQKNLI